MLLFGLVIAGMVKNCLSDKRATDDWSRLETVIQAEADTLLQDDTSKVKWCNCMLNKYKTNYTNSIFTINKDSPGSISFRYGYECSHEIGNFRYKAWSLSFTNVFKKALMKTPMIGQIKEEYKVDFCNCFVNELKERFSYGIKTVVPQNTQDTIALFCSKQIEKGK